MKNTVGYRIRKIRESKDLSQSNMAEELGISTAAYGKIETGRTNPQASRLVEIAKILEVEVTDFFQEKASTVADPNRQYGFATKGDIEEVVQMFNQLRLDLKKDFEQLRSELHPPKKSPKKKK